MNGREEGAALLLALLVLVVLGIVSAALLFVATQQSAVADAAIAAAKARFRARSAAHLALAGWSSGAFRDLTVGESRSFEPLPFSTTEEGAEHAEVERLAGPWFLVRAAARSSSAPQAAEYHVGLLVRAIDPHELAAAFPAALTAGGPVELGPEARIGGNGDDPETWHDCMADASAAPAGIFDASRPGILVPDPDFAPAGPSAAIAGEPPVALDSTLAEPGAFQRIGPLDWEDLERLADRVVAGTVRPAPRRHGGGCQLDAPENGGDPLDPGGPCAGFAPLVYAPGDLTLADGPAQGLLAVAGDLVLHEGARFHGAVLVKGRLHVAAGAAIHGAVRAAAANGPVTVHGRVAYDACALWRAFTRSAALNRPFRQGPRTWVPLP